MGILRRVFLLPLLGTSFLLLGCGSGAENNNSRAPASLTSDPISSDPVTGQKARPSTDANLSVCERASISPGTDVSGFEPGTNWSTVKSSGSSFAFIKATEGVTFTSSLFASDWAAAERAGVARGAYHFFHPNDDAKAQADFFLSVMGTLKPNDLPPLLDWEVTDGVSASMQIKKAKIWLQLVEARTGKIPIIYVDPGFWNALGNPQGFERYPLFIAHYNVHCPSIPPPWSTWSFWQTGVGKVAGVRNSKADIDVFNGRPSELPH